jgi:hypothetical protein
MEASGVQADPDSEAEASNLNGGYPPQVLFKAERHLAGGPTSITIVNDGGSVTLSRMPTVKFAPEAADYFIEVLTILCRDTVAVTIHPQDGEPFGAVLVSNDAKTLVYEEWDKGAGLPSGLPMTISVNQIDELLVF